MFKYFWIIVLVIIAISFLAYSGFVLYETIKEIIENADEDDIIFDFLLELLDAFIYPVEHDVLCIIWGVILSVGFIALFIASIVSFATYMGG